MGEFMIKLERETGIERVKKYTVRARNLLSGLCDSYVVDEIEMYIYRAYEEGYRDGENNKRNGSKETSNETA